MRSFQRICAFQPALKQVIEDSKHDVHLAQLRDISQYPIDDSGLLFLRIGKPMFEATSAEHYIPLSPPLIAHPGKMYPNTPVLPQIR